MGLFKRHKHAWIIVGHDYVNKLFNGRVMGEATVVKYRCTDCRKVAQNEYKGIWTLDQLGINE